MTPNAAPLDRDAIAREVLTECARVIREEQDEPTIASRVEMFARRYAPSPTPPPIPLGAVVGYHEWTGDAWAHRLVRAPNGEARCVSPDDDLHFALTALYHARRERDEARERIAALERECDEAAGLMDEAQTTAAQAHSEWADVTTKLDAVMRDVATALEVLTSSKYNDKHLVQYAWETLSKYEAACELDAARRELAAVKDQGLGATARTSREAPNSEESDCGIAVASPAPASAPLSETAPISCAGNTVEIGKARRWWLVVDDSGDLFAYSREHHARNVWGNLAQIVPVVEARVTRETVDRIAHETFPTVRPVNNADMRRFARALGLTVEGDDNG